MTVTKINAPLLNLQCPPSMRNLPCWLVWRLEQHEGEEKARKVPYYAGGGRRTGSQGSDEDRSKLVTFDAAVAVAAKKNFTGVGFAPMAGLDIGCLDFDNVVGTEHQAEIEAMLEGSYAEFSPSGTGIRAFVRGTFGNRKSHAAQGWPYTFEIFGSKGFVTFTGMVLPQCELLGSDVGQPTEALQRLMAARFAPVEDRTRTHSEAVVGLSEEQLTLILSKLDPDAFYGDWLNVGFALHHETRGEGFEIFHDWCEQGAKYPGRDELAKKWNSFGQRASGNNITGRYLLKLATGAGVSAGGPVASPDDFEVVTEEEAGEAERPARQRFEIIPAKDFASRPPPRWIVDHVIPEADLVTLYGESGAGKSFVALDITMAIARGVEWRGKAVRQGRVVYIAAEGGGGFRNRLVAYAHHHAVDLGEVPFGIIHAAPNLLLKDDVKALEAVLVAAQGAEVIVVDTFAQVTAGANENAGEDMGLALRNARRLGEASGAVVILVHHSGKDASKGARGWSGIRAASDAELEVIKSEGGRWIRTTKQKDGDDTAEWGFELGRVEIGEDDRGRPIDSCVVLEKAVPENRKRGKVGVQDRKPGVWESLILTYWEELSLGGVTKVPRADFIAEIVKRRGQPEGDQHVLNTNATRTLKSLAAKKMIGLDEAYVMLVED